MPRAAQQVHDLPGHGDAHPRLASVRAMTTTMTRPATPNRVGELLRGWRQHRRLSQLDLANDAEVSTRHLSCVETGRAKPSRAFVLHVAEHLDVPLRARNELLVAAGYAPVYSHTDLDAPEMASVREALDLVLAHAEPFPALVVDRCWNLVAANTAAFGLLAGNIDPALLEPPINTVRVSLHPNGLGRRLLNYVEWRDHMLARLHRQWILTGDAELRAIVDEVAAYPVPEGADPAGHLALAAAGPGEVVLPMRLRGYSGEGELTFFSTIATFGTAVDVTLAELAIEAFFPANAHTADVLRQRAISANSTH